MADNALSTVSSLETLSEQTTTNYRTEPVVFPADFPFSAFQPTRTSEVFSEHRKFGQHICTLTGETRPSSLDLQVLTTILRVALEEMNESEFPFDEDRIPVSVSPALIRTLSGAKSNDLDIKKSIDLLASLSVYRHYKDDGNYASLPEPLFYLDHKSDSSTNSYGEVGLDLNSKLTSIILDFAASEVYEPFTLIYLGESRALKSKAAKILHAYFSQALAQGKSSPKHGVQKLVEKVYGRGSQLDVKKRDKVMDALGELEDIGWHISGQSRMFSVTRPNRDSY